MICLWLSPLLINIVFCDIFRNSANPYDDPGFQEMPNYGPQGPASAESRQTPERHQQSPDFEEQRAQPYELYDLEEKLTRAGKWPEFLQKVKAQGDKMKPGEIMKNWEEDLFQWAEYAKNLKDATNEKSSTTRPFLRIAEQMGQPNAGMEMYWGNPEEQNQFPKRNGPVPNKNPRSQFSQRYGPVPNQQRTMSGQQMMDMALNKIKVLEEEERALQNIPTQPPPNFKSPLPPPNQPQFNLSSHPMIAGSDMMKMMLKQIQHLENQIKERDHPKTEPPHFLAGLPLEHSINILRESNASLLQKQNDIFKDFPRVDDFNAPIRWVKYNSNDTEDGLAKITDPETGRNRQYLVNGIFYVPIPDYNIERLGYTTQATTLPLPVLTTERNILRTVMASMNLKAADERDWLAFETIIGQDRSEMTCDGESCQSRCRTMGCQTMCTGDTCRSGCVGPACNSYCKGPGCLSMCIGERCNARCEGLSCDSRCRGKNCEANCNQFSCYYTVNGAMNRGTGSFNQWYPQENGG